ncbi:MAG: crossover junction endodeoxyribonuclease RuvC [bacterium]
MKGTNNGVYLGIDPGIADTGFGVIKKNGADLICLAYGSIKTPKDEKIENRLNQLYQDLKFIIDKYQPVCSGVEQLFFTNNAKTAIIVGEARGVILLTLAQAAVPIREYTPLQIKQAISTYGKAEKAQVQRMVQVILKLQSIPKPDDAADALAIAICTATSIR